MAERANALIHETSPYLLQHAHNPVDWRPWSQATLDKAQAENKPILLSIGYAACHWCHVMAHESFEDPTIAAAMNERFVNVKVDREERPEIDAIYQNALAALGQPGGWPLTMFLTPRGEPFWGGTYFPPTARHGRPGFLQVLETIAETYRAQPDKVAQNVSALAEALARLGSGQRGGAVDRDLLDQAAARLARAVDPFHGGFGDAPKFPHVPALALLWRAWRRTKLRPHRTATLTALTHMAQGGIYDHLGGGFARYAVDEAWLVPHFEKMLYDNAQLVELMTQVWKETRLPLLATRVRETVAWMLREMTTQEGAFAATLDADSDGEEGKFYVWTKAEIDAALGPDAARFEKRYGVLPDGNWEQGQNILNRLSDPDHFDPAEDDKLGPLRARLFAVRAERVPPARDDKVLADWNGLAIAALTRAGLAFDEPEWIAAAQRAFVAVQRHLGQPGDRLLHAWRQGKGSPGTLDDYAQMARAALILAETGGEGGYLDQAKSWVAALDADFRDPVLGGYFLTPAGATDLIVRSKSAFDAATPSGNGTMVEALARLWLTTGQDAYRERADEIVTAFSGEVQRNLLPLATLLNGAETLLDAVQLVVVGNPAAAAPLLRAAATAPEPNLVLQIVLDGADLPPGHPAAGKSAIDDRPTAYVCRGATCSPPIFDADALTTALEQPAHG